MWKIRHLILLRPCPHLPSVPCHSHAIDPAIPPPVLLPMSTFWGLPCTIWAPTLIWALALPPLLPQDVLAPPFPHWAPGKRGGLLPPSYCWCQLFTKTLVFHCLPLALAICLPNPTEFEACNVCRRVRAMVPWPTQVWLMEGLTELLTEGLLEPQP